MSTYHLQLSGMENAWLMEDGTLQIFGQKIAETELETEPEIVGIQYPPEFAHSLMEFLLDHETDTSKSFDEEEDDQDNGDDDDADIGSDEDPYSPTYEAD